MKIITIVTMLFILSACGTPQEPISTASNQQETIKALKAEIAALKASQRLAQDTAVNIYQSRQRERERSMQDMWELQSNYINETAKLHEYNRCNEACESIDPESFEREECHNECAEGDKMPLVVKVSC